MVPQEKSQEKVPKRAPVFLKATPQYSEETKKKAVEMIQKVP